MDGTPHNNADVQLETSIVARTVEPPLNDVDSPDVKFDLKDPDVKDVGWNRDPITVPAPLMHGLSNDDLFTLIRRFNKQVWHVKTISSPSPGLLDLEIAEDEEFSPDKLRANLERLYMTMIVSMVAFAKHIARLRSWNEPLRSTLFCVVYFVAWYSNLIGALFGILLLVLILHPSARRTLFPPAPIAAVSASTGNLQIPRAGTLASKDSISGAPEAHSGEAVEQEAGNFVSGFASLAIGTATGQGALPKPDDEKVESNEEGVDSVMPDPAHLAVSMTDAKEIAHGGRADEAHDATKKPMESVLWEKARPFMRILADTADTWERFRNLLSPTPPFSHEPRLKLAAVFLPVLVITVVGHTLLFVKGTTFLLGIIFFGQPLMTRSTYWLTHRYPNWQRALELRRTLLAGVPTDAQLTITLLRIAEVNRMPIPPPPSPNVVTESAKACTTSSSTELREHLQEHDVNFDTSNYPVDGIDGDSETEAMVSEEDGDAVTGEKPKNKRGSKLASMFKRTTKAAVGGALGIDHLKAKVGSEPAKRRLGAVLDKDAPASGDRDIAGVGEGPTAFSARLHGKCGHLVLVTSAASPFIAFVWDKDLKKALLPSTITGNTLPSAVFAMSLADIRGLRKIGGFGWREKLVVGWALQREIVDGLEIEDANGETRILTAIRGRDDLFNRLVAIEDHQWERW